MWTIRYTETPLAEVLRTTDPASLDWDAVEGDWIPGEFDDRVYVEIEVERLDHEDDPAGGDCAIVREIDRDERESFAACFPERDYDDHMRWARLSDRDLLYGKEAWILG